MKKVKICVTCVNGFLTYDFINSLRNQKDFYATIIGTDITNTAKGKIICDQFYQVADPRKEKNYINDIIQIYIKEKFDILFPLSDLENFVILKNLKLLKNKKINFKLPFTNYEIAKLFYNKKNFLEFCYKNKINVGIYKIVENIDDVLRFIKKNKKKKYILKPIRGSGSKNVYLLNPKIKKSITILESRKCYEINIQILKNKKILNKKNQYIMMPFYEGKIYDIDCIAKKGKIKEFAIRLREIKNRFMFYSTGHRIIKSEKIKRLIMTTVKVLKLNGICDFDVIEDSGKTYLLESSCRFSGSVGVCTLSGLNFPAQMTRYLMGFKKKNYKLNYNNSFRSFLVLKKISDKKKNILLDEYIPHYSKQLDY